MRGLVLLFLVVALGGIAWGYAGRPQRKAFVAVVRKNLLPILLAAASVAVAIVVSTNTVLRLV